MGKEKAGRVFKAGGIAYAKVLRGQRAWHIWRTEVQRLGWRGYLWRGQWKGTNSKRPYDVVFLSWRALTVEWFAFQKNNSEVDEEDGGRAQPKKLKAVTHKKALTTVQTRDRGPGLWLWCWDIDEWDWRELYKGIDRILYLIGCGRWWGRGFLDDHQVLALGELLEVTEMGKRRGGISLGRVRCWVLSRTCIWGWGRSGLHLRKDIQEVKRLLRTTKSPYIWKLKCLVGSW